MRVCFSNSARQLNQQLWIIRSTQSFFSTPKVKGSTFSTPSVSGFFVSSCWHPLLFPSHPQKTWKHRHRTHSAQHPLNHALAVHTAAMHIPHQRQRRASGKHAVNKWIEGERGSHEKEREREKIMHRISSRNRRLTLPECVNHELAEWGFVRCFSF